MNDSFIGEKVGGYEIVERIGGGGMSEGVYRARHLTLDKDVAVKVLDIGANIADDRRKRILSEPRRTAQLNHPNIIRVFDVIDQGPRLYMVMDYVSGGDLRSKIIQHQRERRELTLSQSGEASAPMPSTFVASVIRQVGRALDYAHNQALIHRDIKPNNILITDDGYAILTDFGISKALSSTELSVTKEGVGVGTPPYMSPEQLRGEEITPASDEYSLAIVAYEMLTGKIPFDGETSMVIAHKHMNEEPPAPRKLNPSISIKTEKVLLKALSKKPEDRHGRAGLFATRLAETLVGSSDEILLPKVSVFQAFQESRAWGTTLNTSRLVSGIVKTIVVTLLRSSVYFIIGVLLVSILLGVGGSIIISRYVENQIAAYNLQAYRYEDAPEIIYVEDFKANISDQVTALFPGMVEQFDIVLTPPTQITISGIFGGQPIMIYMRVNVVEGYPLVRVEQFNEYNASVFGPLVAGGLNRGLRRMFDNNFARIQSFNMTEDGIALQVELTQNGMLIAVEDEDLPSGILFQDDFTNLSSGWPRRLTYEAATLGYENGQYRMSILLPNLQVTQRIPETFPHSATIEARLRLIDGPPETVFGLIFLAESDSRFVAALLTGDNNFAIEQHIDGQVTTLYGWIQVPTSFRETWHTIRVSINTQYVIAKVNDTHLRSDQPVDPLLLSNQTNIGLVLRTSYLGSAQVAVDSLTVQQDR